MKDASVSDSTLAGMARWAADCLADGYIGTARRIAEAITYLVDHEARIRELEQENAALHSRLSYLESKRR